MPLSVLEDESARSGRVEVLVQADRRCSWTAEQKRQIVVESLEPDMTPADVARRYGIGTGLLYTWRRQMVTIVVAPAPDRPVDGGMPTEALIAHVVVSKFADSLPLYRQA